MVRYKSARGTRTLVEQRPGEAAAVDKHAVGHRRCREPALERGAAATCRWHACMAQQQQHRLTHIWEVRRKAGGGGGTGKPNRLSYCEKEEEEERVRRKVRTGGGGGRGEGSRLSEYSKRYTRALYDRTVPDARQAARGLRADDTALFAHDSALSERAES